MKVISINGRFLGQPLTGVQRLARELTTALDRRIGQGSLPPALQDARWRILMPESVTTDLPLRNIASVQIGRSSGHFWEQTTLARETRNDILVGFGGSGPLFHRRQLVIIHDVTIFRHPEAFTRSYRATHALLGFTLARTARIGTVSHFSREELSKVFRISRDGIAVIHNAPDHFAALEPDVSVLDRLDLYGKNFFLLVGTLKPNKNIAFAVEAFAALGLRDWSLVIVGSIEPGVFRTTTIGAADNLLFPGRLSDAEIAALERRAGAFIFPSLYEGFGIPPLEAMTQSCPVLAADIPPVREACGEAALYFNPRDQASLMQAMRQIVDSPQKRTELIAKGSANVARFSWEKSADALLAVVADMTAPGAR